MHHHMAYHCKDRLNIYYYKDKLYILAEAARLQQAFIAMAHR